MSFEDQVKARARQLKEEEKKEQAQQKQAEAQFLQDCQSAWSEAIGEDWPAVEWTVYTYGDSQVSGFGSFEYKDHTWLVTPNFREQPLTWTWHESTVHSPLRHSKSSNKTLRDDLLTALTNPPKKPKGFQPFD